MKPITGNLKITVIIPVFNEEKHLSACLSSLANQIPRIAQIIVVDDGSTDRSVQIAKSHGVKVVNQLHLGPGPARNLGAKYATGKILVFVDADMTFRNDFVAKLVDPIISSKTVGTFSDEEFVSNWDNHWSRCWNWNNHSEGNARVTKRPDDQKDFRAILTFHFRKVGGFDSVGYTDSQTLSDKLGITPTAAPGAICFHSNPSTLFEAFVQSKWIGKRKMKMGLFGQLINLFTHTPPLSLLNGILISIKKKETVFPIFKIVYDLGYSIGILQNIFFRSTSR